MIGEIIPDIRINDTLMYIITQILFSRHHMIYNILIPAYKSRVIWLIFEDLLSLSALYIGFTFTLALSLSLPQPASPSHNLGVGTNCNAVYEVSCGRKAGIRKWRTKAGKWKEHRRECRAGSRKETRGGETEAHGK